MFGSVVGEHQKDWYLGYPVAIRSTTHFSPSSYPIVACHVGSDTLTALYVRNRMLESRLARSSVSNASWGTYMGCVRGDGVTECYGWHSAPYRGSKPQYVFSMVCTLALGEGNLSCFLNWRASLHFRTGFKIRYVNRAP